MSCGSSDWNKPSTSGSNTIPNLSNLNKDNHDPDVITVTLVPHKKGLFLKHSEYEISSRKNNSSVQRRYNDFVSFHSFLLTRFPYRMVPRLPPKQLMLDSLIEERRKGLKRWLRIISRHPVLGLSPLLNCFITDTTPEHQQNLRDAVGKDIDEFTKISEDFELPMEDQGRLAASREMMKGMLSSVTKMKKLFDLQAARTQQQAQNMDEFEGALKVLGASVNVFENNIFTEISSCVHDIATISAKYASIQQNTICERLNLLLDVLVAHSDLCERVESGIFTDHQKALFKMINLNKQKIKGVIRGTGAESVAALHEKETVQSSVVGSLGRRSAFSLHCVLEETQLAQSYLQVLPSIILSFSHEQNQESSQISELWNKIVFTEASKLN